MNGRLTDSMEVHPKKAPCPMEVTELGMSMERRDEHPPKAYVSMVVTESGMFIVTRLLH